MTYTVNAAGKALMRQYEGCKLKAYPDPGTGGDPWTIGYGATGPDIHEGLIWTQAQANARFDMDIARFAIKVANLIGGKPTTSNQFSAMVSFAYNCGVGNLASSTLLRKHKAGDFAGARAEFAKWNKAAGKVLPGLVKRRAAEAAIYGSN